MAKLYSTKPSFIVLSFCFLTILSFFGCSGKEEMLEAELAKYLGKADNGLVVQRAYDQVVWRLQLMPNPINENVDLDSQGSHSIHFMLTVSSGQAYKESDVMMTGIGSYPEYSDRMLRLNFRISEMLSLEIGKRTLKPVLSNMENTFGLSEDRKIHIVFADASFPAQLYDYPEMDIVLNDQIFETGISHFVFLEEDLSRIPLLKH